MRMKGWTLKLDLLKCGLAHISTLTVLEKITEGKDRILLDSLAGRLAAFPAEDLKPKDSSWS